MANVNEAHLIGRMTRDAELRYTTNGTAVCSVSLAINRTWKEKGGNKREEVSFIPVVVWGARATALTEYCRKGSPLYIKGRIDSRTYEDKAGQKRTVIEVIAEDVQFLASSTKAGQPAVDADSPAPATERGGGATPLGDDDVPF